MASFSFFQCSIIFDNGLIFDDLAKSRKTIVSIVGARCFAPDIGHAQRAPTIQGAQKLRREAHRRRWISYETMNFSLQMNEKVDSLRTIFFPGKTRKEEKIDYDGNESI
jgi:hypothetical protein